MLIDQAKAASREKMKVVDDMQIDFQRNIFYQNGNLKVSLELPQQFGRQLRTVIGNKRKRGLDIQPALFVEYRR